VVERRTSQEYARVAKFVTPAGYVAGKMAGLKAEQAFMDYTFIHFSGLSDARQGWWSAELCAALGVDQQKLPRIVEPWRAVGEVTAGRGQRFWVGRRHGGGRRLRRYRRRRAGRGYVRPGMVFDMAGTAAVLAGCADTFVAMRKIAPC